MNGYYVKTVSKMGKTIQLMNVTSFHIGLLQA